jgi:hypothetical protein
VTAIVKDSNPVLELDQVLADLFYCGLWFTVQLKVLLALKRDQYFAYALALPIQQGEMGVAVIGKCKKNDRFLHKQ